MNEDQFAIYQRDNSFIPDNYLSTVDFDHNSLIIEEKISEIIRGNIKFYLIVHNHENIEIESYYYLGTVSITYYQGLVILFLGTLCAVISLIFLFSDVRRYFTITIEINIMVIIFRFPSCS